MAEFLCVEVVDLEGAVVDVTRWIRAHEERMMVNVVAASVDMGKQSNVFFLPFHLDVEEVCWDDVEIRCVKFDQGLKVCGAYTVMTELVRG